MYRNKEDQFISYNCFILNQLQAHKQLNHNNQQQNINSWRAQASFHPSLSIRNVLNPQKSFYHQLQVPVGATSHPRLLILLKVPATWSYTRRATYSKTIESCKTGTSQNGRKGIVVILSSSKISAYDFLFFFFIHWIQNPFTIC